MTYTAIMKIEDGRVAKLADFETQEEAEAHVGKFAERFPDAFVVVTPDAPNRDWKITNGSVTIEPEIIPVEKDLVNAERDRRIAKGVPFNGHVFDFDQMGKDNITGAAALAKFAMLGGAKAGDYRWANPNADFSWIVQSNEKVLLDAPTMSALGDMAANWTTKHIFAARALKDMDPIPGDYADDKYWP